MAITSKPLPPLILIILIVLITLSINISSAQAQAPQGDFQNSQPNSTQQQHQQQQQQQNDFHAALILDHNTWLPNKFASIRTHYHNNVTISPPWPNEVHQGLYSHHSSTTGTFELEIDGWFNASTSVFMYITIPDLLPVDRVQPPENQLCLSQDCKYPGTFFEFNVAKGQEGSKTSIKSTQLQLGDVFLSHQSMFWSDQDQTHTIPPSLLIDIIIPLDHFVPLSKDVDPNVKFSLRRPLVGMVGSNIVLESPIISSKPIPDQAKPPIYEHFSIHLDKFSQISNALVLKPLVVELLSPQKGDYDKIRQLTTAPHFTLFSLCSMMTIAFKQDKQYTSWPISTARSSSSTSTFNANFFSPTFLYGSPTFRMGTVSDPWPRRLRMEPEISDVGGYLYPSFIFYQSINTTSTSPSKQLPTVRIQLDSHATSGWSKVMEINDGMIEKAPHTDKKKDGMMGLDISVFLREVFLYRRQTLLASKIDGSLYPVEASTRIPTKGAEEFTPGQRIGLISGILFASLTVLLLIAVWWYYCMRTRQFSNQRAKDYKKHMDFEMDDGNGIDSFLGKKKKKSKVMMRSHHNNSKNGGYRASLSSSTQNEQYLPPSQPHDFDTSAYTTQGENNLFNNNNNHDEIYLDVGNNDGNNPHEIDGPPKQ